MNSIKQITVLMFLILSLNAFSQEKVNWSNIEEAESMSFEKEKPIIIDFTAAWCGWCKKMDATTFQDEEVIQKLNKDFYPVKMDFESPEQFEFNGKKYTAKKLAQKMGVQGLPTMVVVTNNLNSFETIVGYKKAPDFLRQIEKF